MTPSSDTNSVTTILPISLLLPRLARPSQHASAREGGDGGAVGGLARGCLDERVTRELVANGLPDRARPAAVDDLDRRQAGERGVVDKCAYRLARLLRGATADVELVRDVA